MWERGAGVRFLGEGANLEMPVFKVGKRKNDSE